jgi:DNA-binding MarR family transcriptional regulator
MAKKPYSELVSYQMAQLCKAQYNKAEALLSEIGLHSGQDRILLCLLREDGLSQTNLVGELSVQPATVTKSLDRLENAGLVQRRADADDRRVSRVYLTEAGRSLQQKIDDVWQQVEALSFGSLVEEEQAFLRRLFTQVRENLGR